MQHLPVHETLLQLESDREQRLSSAEAADAAIKHYRCCVRMGEAGIDVDERVLHAVAEKS
jgi:hypothetical protein